MIHVMLSRHLWKSAVRSILWKRELGSNIFIGLLFALLGLNVVALAFFLDGILRELRPGENPIALLHSVLLSYFLIDLVVRFFFQKTPSLVVQPYLLLPVRRSQVVRFLLLRSLGSAFNLMPLLMLIPVAITIVAPRTSALTATLWVFNLLCLVITANWMFFYLEKSRLLRPQRIFLFFLVVVTVLILNGLGFLGLSTFSEWVFQWILDYPAASLLILALLGGMYAMNVRSFSRALYLDRLMIAPSRSFIGEAQLGYLDRFGEVGHYLALELKLLLRNKRSRSTIYMGFGMVPLLILMSGFYVEYLEPYPAPEHLPETIIAVPAQTPTQRLVHFTLSSPHIPEGTHVYLTGDHLSLGKWQPSYLPLQRQPDGTWCRSVAFEQGTSLRYILTLGTRENEMKLSGGDDPDIRFIQVLSDTTVAIVDPHWGDGRIPAMVMIMVIYMGILSTGFLTLVYGQFLFSWESAYFDLLISRPVNVHNYLYAKFVLLQVFGVMSLSLNGFTALISWKLLAINAMLMLYNAGVNVPVLIGWSMLSRKRMDLNASIMSTQGKGSSQFMTILPTFILPVALYILLNLLGAGSTTLVVFGVLGLLGLLFHRPLLVLLLRFFSGQRYKMAMGFRER